MSTPAIYASILALTLVASFALWWLRPATAARWTAATDRPRVFFSQLGLYITGISIFAFIPGAPGILIAALMYQFLASVMLQWVGSLFSPNVPPFGPPFSI